MITTKIEWIDKNKLAFKPIEIGPFIFQEFICKIFEKGTLNYDLQLPHRTQDTYTIDTDSILDGTSISEGLYWAYACFQNKRLHKIGLCRDGLRPQGYEYYTKINFAIPVSSNKEFLKFSNAEVRDNNLMSGGWFGITENNLWQNGYRDYWVDNLTCFISRKDDCVYTTGLVYMPSNPIVGQSIFKLPSGFGMRNYIHCETILISNLLMCNIAFNCVGNCVLAEGDYGTGNLYFTISANYRIR